jgi:tetratricopeptide (TPR) repeat protein
MTVAAFLPTLQNEFVRWDDHINFLENPHYRGLGWTQLRWMFTTFHLGVYQPLSWMVLGLQYLLWGMNPVGYHVTSLLLHATNAVLVYLVAMRLLRLAMPSSLEKREIALHISAGFGAVLFAVHPLRVEAVAWASAQPYLLSALFFLLSILVYLRACTIGRESQAGRPRVRGSLVLFTLAVFAKAIAVSLPLVLLVLDVYPLRRLGGGPGRWFGLSVRPVWREKLPFFLIALAAAAVAPFAKAVGGTLVPLEKYGVSERLAQSLYGLIFYLWKTGAPLGLSPLYELPIHLNPLDAPFLLSAALVLAISVSLVMTRRWWPAGLATWVCYGAILLPNLGVIRIGHQIAADRYSYLSCLGWMVLAGAGLLACWRARMSGRIGRPLFALIAGFAMMATTGLGVLTWHQVQVWHDSERLWRHVLAVDPKSDVAHNNLGFILVEQGQLDEAIYHYRQALRIEPRDANFHLNLGIALARQGQLDEAIYHYRQALQLQPTHAEVHDSLADALANLGKVEEAIHHYLKAVKIRPGFVQAHNNLGNILSRQGKLDEAIQHYQQALQIQPNFAQAYNNLGAALVRQGKLDEAISQYRQAVQIQPTYAEAHSNLGWALGQAGRLEEAIVSYQTALQVAPKDWPHRQFVQNKLNETRARLQMDKSR